MPLLHNTAAGKAKHLSTLRKLIVVLGRFDYTDAFKDKRYETRFCFERIKTGATMWCLDPGDNYIK
jgi:hypothetical protein